MKVSSEVAHAIANVIWNQIKSEASPFALMSWGIEGRSAVLDSEIHTDKGVIDVPAFGGGFKMDTINHSIGGEFCRLVRVRVMYSQVPDDYTVVITAPVMTEPKNSFRYELTDGYANAFEKKGEPEKLLYSNHNKQGFYFDDLFGIIDGIIETGVYKPNYGG